MMLRAAESLAGTLWLVDGTGSALMRFDEIVFCYNKSQRVRAYRDADTG